MGKTTGRKGKGGMPATPHLLKRPFSFASSRAAGTTCSNTSSKTQPKSWRARLQKGRWAAIMTIRGRQHVRGMETY